MERERNSSELLGWYKFKDEKLNKFPKCKDCKLSEAQNEVTDGQKFVSTTSLEFYKMDRDQMYFLLENSYKP